MTWCDHCRKPEQQLSDHHDNKHDRIESLCGPCWRWAIYRDTLRPLKIQEKAS